MGLACSGLATFSGSASLLSNLAFASNQATRVLREQATAALVLSRLAYVAWHCP